MLKLEYLFEDKEVPALGALADYDTLDFVSDGSHIYGEIMWPDSEFKDPRPCVILSHGFPGSARNDDISHALCRIGCVVMVPHHRGAWGSEGKYLLSNCIEDAKNLAEYARTPDFCGRYNVDPTKVFLAGHSMGGCTALHAGKNLPWLAGIVMITPFDPTVYLDSGQAEVLKNLLTQGKIMRSDGVEAIFEDISSHRDALRFATTYEQIKNRNVLFLVGTRDSITKRAVMIDPLWGRLKAGETTAIHRLREFPAEHGLLGSRIGCIREIAEFVCDCCNSSFLR